ncbi:enolase C-terminal domain-like protein [Nocardiopsis suaedae]|uniref:Mandelate racemase n=1 Tax=Nocardiopsis suaedae TaxID=3018444 RepID=A0ABT4TGG8_9ACTN|nr:enolase C-terminal domain-like protein [Nocardiopsis suaedae]MDA2803808.1 mandelate racemase [Nocardiopsis suaedae]
MGPTAPPDTAVRSTDAAAYRVPLPERESDATLTWGATTMVVVRVDIGEAQGLGYTYADATCADYARRVLGAAVHGGDGLDVPAAWDAMRRAVRNDGRPGLVSCAMSAVETALWDAAARAHGIALCRMFGRVRRAVPVYASGGFTGPEPLRAAERAGWWAQELGAHAVKIKIGGTPETGPEDPDPARIERAREAAGGAQVYADANGAYGAKRALRAGAVLDALGVAWFEEPVSSDDLDGLRRVRDGVRADVTAGEYGYHLPYLARMAGAGAVDCLQADVTRCGGFGTWFRAAAAAAGNGLAVSAHCAPALAVHAAVATHNVRHIEWFADHERVESALLDGAPRPVEGDLAPDPSAPGHGMRLKAADAERYRVG